jgi:hypothetical protein
LDYNRGRCENIGKFPSISAIRQGENEERKRAKLAKEIIIIKDNEFRYLGAEYL